MKFKVAPLFVLFCLFFSSGAAQAQYSRLVVFGDSLSDTGNLAEITFNFPFPFYRNRISNGPVTADRLATSIGSNADASLHLANRIGGYNYSVAGGNIKGSDTEDLSAQMSAYLSRDNAQADPAALYLVMMGGNDLRDVRSFVSSAAAQLEMDSVLDVLSQQLQRLIDAGAQWLVVPNGPNIGRIPETLERESSDPGVSQRATQYTQYFNQQLKQRLTSLARENRVRITQFDLFSELESLIANASALGFSNTEEPCFELSGFRFHSECVLGTRFDRFVFFDNIHPTEKTHRLIGESLIRTVPTGPTSLNGVPISGAIYLLLSND